MSYSRFAWFYDRLQENVDYKGMAEFVNMLVERFDGRKNILLDLACGTGSLTEQFAKMGYDCIGVDVSDEMLSEALDKKYDSGSEIQYLCQDMTELDMFGTVDVTVCALDSINHLDSLESVRKTFERVSLFAFPDGMFIFDCNTIYKHREILGDNAFVYDLDNLFCVWQNEYHSENNSVDIALDFFEKDENAYKRYSELFSENAYAERDIDKALDDAGFEILGKYDDYADKPICDRTQRVVYCCRKVN